MSRVEQKILALNKMISNVILDRRLWLQRQIDPRRDIDAECGHPESITTEDFLKYYTRGDIAARVVEVWPQESWGEDPMIFETEDEVETEFEKAWNALQMKHKIYSTLERADILSGIGRFGILLLGLDDGAELSQIAPGIDERGVVTGGQEAQLLYLRPFDEGSVTVDTLESDATNPRYGQPKSYTIRFTDNTLSHPTEPSTAVPTGDGKKVHWSRVIHLADNRMSSDVYGVPRMQKVFNRLLDLNKIAGGSGEMFWKGGFPGVALEGNTDGDDFTFDEEATKEQIEAYQNGLQRYLALTNMTAKSLAVQVADPEHHVDMHVRLISLAIGVPWRIFMGSEAAQLASEQDMRAWNRRLNHRRRKYVTPYILLPMIERLIAFGVLPQPKNTIVSWPDLNSPSDKDKAEVAEKKTNALSKYVISGVDALFPPFHYLTSVLGMSDIEARAVIEEAGDRIDELGPPEEDEPEEAPTTPRNGSPTPTR